MDFLLVVSKQEFQIVKKIQKINWYASNVYDKEEIEIEFDTRLDRDAVLKIIKED